MSTGAKFPFKDESELGEVEWFALGHIEGGGVRSERSPLTWADQIDATSSFFSLAE